jgi:hypothetical protein
MIEVLNVKGIELASVKDEIDFAYHTAYQKSINRNTANTWQKNRSGFRKFTDLFAGDLAKNLVRNWLKQQHITVIDYDQIRTDNFNKPDEFDLKHHQIIIEVKSSIEKHSSEIENLLEKRRFIIYPQKEFADIIVQVFYVFENEEGKNFFSDMELLADDDLKEKHQIYKRQDFVNAFIKHAPKALLMGFVTKAMAQENKKAIFKYGNNQLDGDLERDYINFLLKDGYPTEQLHQFLTE